MTLERETVTGIPVAARGGDLVHLVFLVAFRRGTEHTRINETN